MPVNKDILTRIPEHKSGSIHPINQIKSFILDFLSQEGFTYLDGPEIESVEYNFDKLNIKENHPARQMHDTFYVEDGSFVLRTHTSPYKFMACLKISLLLLLLQLERFIGKMTMQRIYLCLIKLKEFL